MASLFEDLQRNAEVFGDSFAVASSHGQLTWAKLFDEAAHIAGALITDGAARLPVTIFAERTPKTVAAFYGCMLAGCQVCLIPAETRGERVSEMLDLLQPRLILYDRMTIDKLTDILTREAMEMANKTLHALLRERREDCDIRDIEEMIAGDVAQRSGLLMPTFACQLLTMNDDGSFSAVSLDAETLKARAQVFAETLSLTPGTVLMNELPLGFPNLVVEIAALASVGGTLVLPAPPFRKLTKKLRETAERFEVNTLVMTPAGLLSLCEGGHLPGVDCVLVRTDGLSEETAAGIADGYPSADLHTYRDSAVLGGPMLLDGRPFPDILPVVLDRILRPLGPGETGDIFFVTVQPATGFVLEETKTEERFFKPDVIASRKWREENLTGLPETARLVKTLLRGYYTEEGEIVITGRQDDICRHAGEKIDLAETAASVQSVDGVDETKAFLAEDGRLFVFYTGEAEENKVSLWCEVALDDAARPDQVMKIQNLPRRLDGEIDLVRLGAMTKIFRKQKQ